MSCTISGVRTTYPYVNTNEFKMIDMMIGKISNY